MNQTNVANKVQSVRQEGVTEAETQRKAKSGQGGGPLPRGRPTTQETHMSHAVPSVPRADSGVIKMFSRPFETKQRKTLFLGDNGSNSDVALFIYLFFHSYYDCNSSLAARRLQCEQF